MAGAFPLALLLAGMLLAVLIILPWQSYEQTASTQTDDKQDKPVLVVSDKKIVLTKYIGLNHTRGPVEFYFYLDNNGISDIHDVKVIPSALTTKQPSKFSLAPSVLGSDNVTITAENKPANSTKNGFEMTHPERVKIKYSIKEEALHPIYFNEAVYEGQVLVYGQKIEPITIDVSISFKDDPWFNLIFVILGVAMAVGLGAAYTYTEKKREICSDGDDDADVISHINGHIRSINALRNTIKAGAWDNITQAYNEKRIAIEKYRDQIELDDDAEAVKWFEQTDEYLRDKNLLEINKGGRFNPPLPEIDKPEGENYERLKKHILHKRARAQLRSSVNWKKGTYLVAVAGISSITALFADSSYLGNSLLNIAVAISIGFAAYRAQDLLNFFAKKDGDTKKDAEK